MKRVIGARLCLSIFSIAVIIFLSGSALATNVDTTKGWHPLQQISINSANLTRVDDNANGIIDSSENSSACNADAVCEVTSLLSSGYGTFGNQVNLGGSWAQVQSTGLGIDLELRTSGTGDIHLNPGGNVGIGTAMPSSRLEVQGGNISSSHYVRGMLGLCIGSDCRTAWPADTDTDTRCDSTGTCSQLCIGSDCRAAWPVSNSGDITAVLAGAGLAGGASSGDTTLSLNTAGISSCTNPATSKIYWSGSQLACGTDQTGASGVTSVSGSGGITTSPTTGVVGVSLTNPSVSCPGQAVQSFNLATGSVTCAALSSLSGSGSSGYIPKWAGSSSLGNSIIYDNGNVGIGTASPIYKLEVIGQIRASAGTAVYSCPSNGDGCGSTCTGSLSLSSTCQSCSWRSRSDYDYCDCSTRSCTLVGRLVAQ